MNARELTAREIMTQEVISVQVDDSVEEAAQLLLDARITGAPVIDRWSNAVGVFTLANACESNNHHAEAGARIEEDEAFYRLDLKRRFPISITLDEWPKDKKVGDVMTPAVHSVLDTSTLAEVTNFMLDRGIHRLFVRDRDNKLMGIITSMDLLRVFAEVLEDKLVPES
jgi:predicted transcriptional regulator